MNYLMATLSAGDSSNWAICKRAGLWGTPARVSHAKHAVRVASPGDRLFVWQSGAGLIAMATLAGEPFEFLSEAEVPWPSPESYHYGIPIADIHELPEPIADPFDEYVSRRFGVQTHQLQSGFAVLRPEQAHALAEAFDGAEPQAAPGASTVADPPPLAAAYLKASSSIVEALLALYRQNRLAAESGELILIGPAELRPSFEEERRKPPFDELGERVQFVTPDELEQRLRTLGP